MVNLKIQCVTFVYFNYLFHAIFGIPIWSNKMLILMEPCILSTNNYLSIRPVALKGYGSVAHEAKPNGLLTRGP